MNRAHHFSLVLLVGIVMCCSDAALGQNRPKTKITILEPTVGAELKKTAKVRVKVTLLEGGKLPSSVYFSVGGPPWVRMEQADEPGQWDGQIDSTMIPNGSHRLNVITDDRRARTRIRVNVQNPLRFYFAGLHSHTAYSDGTLTPAVAHEYARDKAKLDVFCLTDHLESVDEIEWLDMREQAWDFNENGKFVVIPGLEWTKKWGHVNLYDPKTRHWPEEPEAFYKAIAAADVVAKFNHPGDGTKSHGGLEYSEAGDQAIQLMEVRREKEEKAFIRALDKGWHLAPDGSDDTHAPNWGNAGRWTGILAPGSIEAVHLGGPEESASGIPVSRLTLGG